MKLKFPTKAEAEIIKKELAEILGYTVFVKPLGGTLKFYYSVNSGKVRGYSFSVEESAKIKKYLMSKNGYFSLGKITDETLDLHFQSQVTFMLAED
jgi:hypothetical protein